MCTRQVGSVQGRRWSIPKNDPEWIYRFAMQPDYTNTRCWKQQFRIPFNLFRKLCVDLAPSLLSQNTNMRKSIAPDKKIAAFLMYSSNRTASEVADQLGLGSSSVMDMTKEVSRVICTSYSNNIRLPTTAGSLAHVMEGFKKIAGLPYCVGAIDGTHIPWLRCPKEQYFEYRCYKGFTSLVTFAVSDANRRFVFLY